MMSEHKELDGQIKALFGGRDDASAAAHGCAVAERRLDEAIAGRAPRVRRRRIARPLVGLLKRHLRRRCLRRPMTSCTSTSVASMSAQ